jgi:carboxylate-amine ligase
MDASPTSGPPPRLAGWADYARLVDRLVSTGLIESPKELWWDARPSPEFGTVEVRVCDMPPDLASAQALTALIQCLVTDLARGPAAPPGDPCDAMVVRQNRWRAARYGMAAEFVDPRTGRRDSARDAVGRLADRLADAASELHCAAWLERAVAIAKGPTGAERQLAVFERTGDLAEVVRSRMIPGVPPSPSEWDAPPVHQTGGPSGAGLRPEALMGAR